MFTGFPMHFHWMQATPAAFRRLCDLQQEMASRLAALRSQLAEQLLAHINEPLLMKWVGHIQGTFRNILARGINTSSSSAWRLPPFTTHPRVVFFLNIQGTFMEHSWNIQGWFATRAAVTGAHHRAAAHEVGSF
jgi:hypothetical protein